MIIDKQNEKYGILIKSHILKLGHDYALTFNFKKSGGAEAGTLRAGNRSFLELQPMVRDELKGSDSCF